MTHPPAAPNYIEQQAGSLQSGDHLLLPDGNRSAEIQRVDVETDDFGTPAMVLATLTGGGGLRIAAASTVLILEAAAEADETPVEDPGSPLQLVEPATDDDGARGRHGRTGQEPGARRRRRRCRRRRSAPAARSARPW